MSAEKNNCWSCSQHDDAGDADDHDMAMPQHCEVILLLYLQLW